MSIFQKVQDLKNDFTTYPSSFESYKWYKPILAFIVVLILFIILSYVPNLFIDIETFDFATWGNVLSNYYVIIYIPCIFLAAIIIRDRPFSSYLSSHGGWKWGIFVKSLIVALCVTTIFSAADIILGKQTISLQTSLLILVISIILVPIQCFAEELLYRGLLMQAFGSWFRIPIIAIIIQGVLFTYMHAYDLFGIIAVFGCSLVFGFVAWYSKGLEISTAMHTSNNILTTITGAIVISTSTGPTILDSALMIAQMIIIFAIILVLDKRFNWFGLKKESQSK